MKKENITSQITNCYDPDEGVYHGGIYSFTMNGQTYYTTLTDLNNSYASGSGNNNIDANGAITKIAPFVAYSYRNNRSIGVKFQYSTASGAVQQGDLDLLSDDLNFHVEDIRADLLSFQAAVYHRSYVGLDNKGRIGLFNDIVLGYTNSRTEFVYDTNTEDTYARTDQVKLSLHPGVVIFVMNNISMHVSMGIGGVSYNNTKYIKNGETIGKRDFSKANFKLDVLGRSIG